MITGRAREWLISHGHESDANAVLRTEKGPVGKQTKQGEEAGEVKCQFIEHVDNAMILYSSYSSAISGGVPLTAVRSQTANCSLLICPVATAIIVT